MRHPAVIVALSFAIPFLAAPAGAGPSGHDCARHPHGARWVSDDADGFGWAVIDGESDCMSDAMDEDAHAALVRETRAAGRPLLWLRVDGRDWIVRDRAMVKRAEGVLQPMRDLGREMGRLGAEQGRQGAEMGRYGAELGRLAGRRAVVQVKLAMARLEDGDALGARERMELERECRALERRQARCERSRVQTGMRGVEARMEDLGRRMGEMGRRMDVLAERAEREMRALAREAIATRRAVRFGAGTRRSA